MIFQLIYSYSYYFSVTAPDNVYAQRYKKFLQVNLIHEHHIENMSLKGSFRSFYARTVAQKFRS